MQSVPATNSAGDRRVGPHGLAERVDGTGVGGGVEAAGALYEGEAPDVLLGRFGGDMRQRRSGHTDAAVLHS